jgi:hypothetical protein
LRNFISLFLRKAIYAEGEVQLGATCKDFLQVRSEGRHVPCAMFFVWNNRSSEYVSGGPGLFVRSTEYHLSAAFSSNQKVMLPRFTSDAIKLFPVTGAVFVFFLGCHVEPNVFLSQQKIYRLAVLRARKSSSVAIYPTTPFFTLKIRDIECLVMRLSRTFQREMSEKF